MTVTVGRTDLTLGWQVAVVVALFLIGAGWRASSFLSDITNEQHQMSQQLNAHLKTDSSYHSKTDSKIDHLNTAVLKVWYSGDSLKNQLNFYKQMQARKPIGFYTEKKVNGRLMVSSTNN